MYMLARSVQYAVITTGGNPMQRRTMISLAALAATLSTAALAQTGEIRIAHVYSKTGPLEAYGKQTQTGLMMGLSYATGGSMTINGKKLVVIEKDDQGKPDLGKSLLAAAYSDDKADIAVGPTSSGVALALLPVAEEYKKILLVEPAVADAITGDKWNKYIFRTGRNSSQDAISNAVAIDKAGVTVATLAQDYAFGRDGVKAFKDALKNAKLVHEEYLPTNTTDFTAGAQRLIDKLKDQPGRKINLHHLGGGGQPVQDRRSGPGKALRHQAGHGRQHPAGHGGLQELPGHGRCALLLLWHPQEPDQRRHGGPALHPVQVAARLLHGRWLLGGHGHRDCPQEDQRGHQHRKADFHHGRHEL
jgi:hypothetical protein